MTVEAATERAANYIERNDWVTMVELQKKLDGLIPTKGNLALEVHGNLVLWVGMSEESADVLELLRVSGRITLDVGSPLAYLMDGASLTLPLAKRPPQNGYRKPHWVPVFLRPKKDGSSGRLDWEGS